MKPETQVTGHVDGGWWPYSRDLGFELPGLLGELAERLGGAHRITYNLTAWRNAPRRLSVDGFTWRLGGFRTQHVDTITVIGHNASRRVTLLVVPPETGEAEAQLALASASAADNKDAVDALLAR